MSSCFLSYARDDDEPFVERLSSRLRQRGIDVWWDREAMRSSGVHFLQEIQDGIRSRAWFVLVSGPAAADSGFVAHEIEAAATTCLPTVLVLRVGDRQDVPPRFRHHHQFDLRVHETGRDFAGLVRTLKGDVPTPGRVVGALPAAPAHLLRRDTDLESVVRDALADVTDPLAITSASAAASVTGMAGAGKTVLATLAARDCRMRHHFRGGVVFVRLGPAATAQSAAQDIRRVLRRGGIGDATWTGDNDAVEYLRKAARADKRLFVLDDVWEVEQLAPVMDAVAGTPSRILLTTRRTDLGRGVGVVHHRLALLDPPAAHRFLLEWAGSGVASPLPDGVAEVARACGYLPLGLAVAGFLVGDGLTWTDLATLLRDAELRALDVVLGAYEHAGVYAAIDLSARRLASERPDLWSRYLDLALFDGAVPRTVVARHWVTASLAAVRRDLQYLIRRSLLTDAEDDSIVLHDLHRSYLLARGASPRALARRFIDTLGGPDDWIDQARSEPWLRRNLVSLLCTAGYDSQMLALQRRPGDHGAAPAWFELRSDRGELHEYWADLDRADLDQRSRINAPELLGGIVERAVVRATLRSFSSRPPELTLAALRTGALSPLAAWREAGQMPRGRARLTALTRLAPVLQARDERISAGLSVLEELSTLRERDQDDILHELVTRLPEPEVVDRVLSLAGDAGAISSRVLIALAPHLDQAQRRRARYVADRLDEPERRVALAGLTLGPDEAAVDQELWLALKLEPRDAIAVLIHAGAANAAKLIPRLAPLVDGYFDALFAFPQLWRMLPAEQIARFLAGQHDLDDVPVEPLTIARSLCEIVAAQPQLAPTALEIARRLDPSYLAISVLEAAAFVADVDARPVLLAEVVDRINEQIESGSGSWIADISQEAFRSIPVDVAFRLADVAERITFARNRCRAIAALVPRLPAEHAGPIIRRELRRLDTTIDGHEVRDALAALAPVVGAGDIGDALLVADGPRDNGFDIAGLGTLAGELDEQRRSEPSIWALSAYLPGGPNAARPVWALSFLVEEILELDTSPGTVTVARELIANIDDGDAFYRVGPLAVLARVAPGTTTWSDVEAALAGLHEDSLLARATARAARLGPPGRQAELVGRCLELVESVDARDQDCETVLNLLRTRDERAVRQAVRLLDSSWGERFDELYAELPLTVLESLRPMIRLDERDDRLLIEYAVRLATSGRETEALAVLRLTESLTLGEGLRRLAPLLSRSTVKQLLSGSPAPDERTAAALCVRLAELGDLQTAVQTVRRDVANPGWRLPALANCAAVDARAGHAGLVDGVLDDLAAVAEHDHVDAWWKALDTLGVAIAALPAELRPARLSRAIHIASSRSRLQAIPGLWGLAPAYAAVAGPDGVWEVFDAVRRVLGWWPSQNHLAANRRG